MQSDLEDLSTTLANDFNGSELKKVDKAFRKASTKAPKSVKSSLVKIAKFYESLGGFDDGVGALRAYTKDASKYSKAFTKLATYCASGGGSSASSRNPQSTGRGGAADVVVAVDGKKYPVTTIQTCDTTGSRAEPRSHPLRVRQVRRACRAHVHAPACGREPVGHGAVLRIARSVLGVGWPVADPVVGTMAVLSGDRSSVSGSATMDDSEGQSVDVTFDVTCN